MDQRSVAFNKISYQLAQEFQAKNNPNFTGTPLSFAAHNVVVVQPGVSGLNIGKFGEDYLSSLDCFHPNEYANMAFTIAIWNNMWTPEGQKATTLDPDHLFIKCPDDNTFIQ